MVKRQHTDDKIARREAEAIDPASPGGVTVRSIVLGALMAVVVILFITHVEFVAATGRLNISHFPVGLAVPYTVVALGNAVLRRKGAQWALSRSEMLTVLSMGLIGSAVPAYGLGSFFLGMLATPYYLATPENQWGNFFHQYLPTWLFPQNESGTMAWFFEGMPTADTPIPWSVWGVPLMGWMPFIGAVVLGSLCLSVMLRKQWAEHERLAYPMLQPASDLAEAEERLPLLRDVFLWLGAAIPLSIFFWNALCYFSHAVPRIPYYPRIALGRGWMRMGKYFPRIHIRLNFHTLAFAYFANVDVLFSIWVFYLFFCSQVALYRRIGIHMIGLGAAGDQTTALQGIGAFLALVVWGLWIARGHLRDVFRKAARPSCSIDDRGELLSYRTCVFGLGLSLVFIVSWMHAVGIAWAVSVVLALGTLATYLGVARVISETGVIYYCMPVSGRTLLPFVFGGTRWFDGPTHTALGVVDSIRSQTKAMFMVPLAHAARIAGSVPRGSRRLALGIVLALVVGVTTGFGYFLHLGYTHGAYNFGHTNFLGYPPFEYDALVRSLRGEDTWRVQSFYFLGLGVLIYIGVSVMRYRFSWWPLAPIGMVVPSGHAVHSMFSIFVAWGIKKIILRTGGATAYRRFRPLFLGVFVGYALSVLASYLIDQIWFPARGHFVHAW